MLTEGWKFARTMTNRYKAVYNVSDDRGGILVGKDF
jgi:hypothetical protein